MPKLQTVNKRSSLTINPWSTIPSLGNLDAYIAAVNKLPFLTKEEELDYANSFKEQQDLAAASKLVLSHLRFVVAISRQYLGYGLAQADLIQEGNIGLMKAVKKFDPTQGVRLVSYAVHWIKSEIHEYILRNWRIVKIATTKAQRKLFFNLRSLKNSLHNDAEMLPHSSLTHQEINTIAEQLNVKPEEVLEMETRLGSNDLNLDPISANCDEENYAPIHYLTDANNEPTKIIEQRQRQQIATDGMHQAIQTLDDRSKTIIEERWLKVNDDGSGGKTLHDLAAEFNVSAERIRQIETAAMKKIKIFLENYQNN